MSSGIHIFKNNGAEESMLKTKRIELRLTQREVAEKAGITFQQYQKFEVGTRDLSKSYFMTVCKVLTVLDIDITEFFKEELQKMETTE